jgi:hypothetical protein
MKLGLVVDWKTPDIIEERMDTWKSFLKFDSRRENLGIF